MALAPPVFHVGNLFARRRRARLQPVAPVHSNGGFHRALPWLLGGLLLTLLPLIGQVPFWTLAVFGGCTAWRYWLEISHRALPSLLGRVLVFLPIAYLVMSTYGSKPGATGLLTFLISLLSLKILELRTLRDFTVASLLGFFMVLAALFFDQSLTLCVFLGVIVLIQTVALLYCHGGLRRLWPTVRLASGMGLQALPLVILLFVVFPRVQSSFLHHFGGGTNGKTGMSDHLRPGSFSALAQSSDPVFRAVLTAPPGQRINQGELYWRGAVLDVCNQPLVWSSRAHYPVTPSRDQGGVKQQIQLFWGGQKWLFALDQPTGFRVEYPPDLRADLMDTRTILSREPLYRSVIYTAYSTSNLRDATPLDKERLKALTQLPAEIGPRSRALAEGWRRNAGQQDEAVLLAARQFFGTNNFLYTLTPGLLPSELPLDYFLFQSRRGFCEHYAAAYCTLMRAAGIPARIVVGYQGGEYNRWGTGHYLIRQSDAHAWAEVWLAGRGWVREDPTALVAPERVTYGAESYSAMGGGLSTQLRLERLARFNAPGSLRWVFRNASQIWDSVDERWNQVVLGYNQDTRLTVMEKLGLEKLSLLKGTLLTLVIAFALLGVGGGIIYLLGRDPARRGDPAQRVYQQFCRRLSTRAGLTRQPVEGPLDFARRAATALPTQATDIRRITDLYVASRYARDSGKSTLAALREAVARFRVSSASA